MRIYSATPMPADMVEAVAFCMGPSLGPDRCRQRVMTDAIDGPDHAGLDHICGEPKDHPNRHRCAREGCGSEWTKEER